MEERKGNIFKVLGWFFSLISLLMIPLLFGILGVLMGFICKKYNIKSGNKIIFSSIICTILGTIINLFIIYQNMG